MICTHVEVFLPVLIALIRFPVTRCFHGGRIQCPRSEQAVYCTAPELPVPLTLAEPDRPGCGSVRPPRRWPRHEPRGPQHPAAGADAGRYPTRVPPFPALGVGSVVSIRMARPRVCPSQRDFFPGGSLPLSRSTEALGVVNNLIRTCQFDYVIATTLEHQLCHQYASPRAARCPDFHDYFLFCVCCSSLEGNNPVGGNLRACGCVCGVIVP